MRSVLWMSLVISSVIPCSAVDLTKEQKSAIENAAVLGVVGKSCPEFQIAEAPISAGLSAAKVQIDREPFLAFATTKSRETEAVLSTIGLKGGCEVFFKLYGPAGTAQRGLMTRR